MAEPIKPLDTTNAIKHLDKVDAEIVALSIDDKNQQKPGMNPHLAIKRLTAPLRVELETKPTEAAIAKAMVVKAEEPLVAKFHKNPLQK